MQLHAGYYVAGRGLGETDDEWAEIVAQVKLDLPPQKPLFVCGVGGPRDIVSNVKLGFDVLETRYALTCALDVLRLSEMKCSCDTDLSGLVKAGSVSIVH